VSELKKILTMIFIATNFQSWGEVISTNISNGNLIRTNYSVSFSGVTNNLTLPAGKQLNILSINTYPQSTNAAPFFIRGILPNKPNNSLMDIRSWNGSIYGPMEIQYGIDAFSKWVGQSDPDPTSWPSTTVFFRYEIKNDTAQEAVISSPNISSTSIVVPSNAVGDVDVLLEQSTDMITWTQCLPGTYNASTQKRFFRVRAVEK
jgi:hypothetical protein